MMKKRKKLFGFFLGLTMMVSGAAICGDSNIVNAAEVTIADDVTTTEAGEYKEIKSLIDEALMEDIDWVEAIISSEENIAIKSVWFSKAEEQWNIPVTDWEEGHYTVSLYKVMGDQIGHQDDSQLITKLDFIQGEVTFSSFEAKSTTNKESGKPNITVNLKGLQSPCEVKKVVFSFTNKKGKVVYTKSVNKQENGNYKLEVPASKLNSKAGKYKVTASVKAVCGAQTILAQEASAELKLANATVKATSADKKAGTFIFKTNAIKAIGSVKEVRMNVWCKKSDKKTYKKLKKQSDGKYAVKIDVSKHSYHFGTYHAEVVVILKDGSKAVVASNTYNFAPKNFMRYEKTTQKNKKTIWMYNPTENAKIYADVWSKDSKGADKLTYEVQDKGTALKFTINMKKLTHSGTVYVLYKQKTGAGYVDVKKVSFTATDNDISKHGWFYEKAANGQTYKYYYSKGKKVTDLTNVLNIKNETMYIEVNKQHCTVTVYMKDPETGKWNVPVNVFACSVGNPTSLTPSGVHHTSEKYRWHELMGPSYGQYCTRIVGGVLFHSVAGSNMTPYNLSAYSYNKLGSPASHGCVRLCVRDAKWIYDHCKIGTKVYIFNSSFQGPLGKPATIKIPYSQHYDPTDPAVKK